MHKIVSVCWTVACIYLLLDFLNTSYPCGGGGGGGGGGESGGGGRGGGGNGKDDDDGRSIMPRTVYSDVLS